LTKHLPVLLLHLLEHSTDVLLILIIIDEFRPLSKNNYSCELLNVYINNKPQAYVSKPQTV
jgi:hypothetical protein